MTFPYSTNFGTYGSITCSEIKARTLLSLFLHFSPIDCHGMTILSKYPITKTDSVWFDDKVPALMESLVRKGALSATVKIPSNTEQSGETIPPLIVTAVNSHFSGRVGD